MTGTVKTCGCGQAAVWRATCPGCGNHLCDACFDANEYRDSSAPAHEKWECQTCYKKRTDVSSIRGES